MNDFALTFRHYKIQRLRRLIQNRSYRYSEKRFVVEGVASIHSALEAKTLLESVFYDPEISDNQAAFELLLQLQSNGIRCHELQAGVMDRVADCVTPQPICAIAELREYGPELLEKFILDTPKPYGPELNQGDFDSSSDQHRIGQAMFSACQNKSFLVAADVRDPGNLGTLYRVADASGMTALIALKGCADPFSPKTVRSSAGSVFNIPIITNITADELVETCRRLGICLLASDVDGGEDYTKYEYRYPLAVLFGNESKGLDNDLKNKCDFLLNIALSGKAESLNVAMAAAVICFEIKRRQTLIS